MEGTDGNKQGTGEKKEGTDENKHAAAEDKEGTDENKEKPDEANKSDDAKKPDEVTKPVEATKPDEAKKPDDVTKSDDVKKPDDVKKSEEATKPEEVRKSDDIKKPEEAAEPDKVRKSDDSKEPDEAQRPGETRKSGDTKKTDKARKSGHIKKPDETKKSGDTKKTGKAKKSSDLKKPDQTRKSGDTKKPDEVRKSDDTKMPEEARKSDDAKKPDEVSKSDEAQKPDDAIKSAETKMPDETRTSGDTKKPDKPRKSGDRKKPDETRKSDDTKKPDKPRKSDDTKKPDESRKSDDTKKPDETRKSGDAQKPDEVKKPDDAHKSEEARKSGDTQKPDEARKSGEARKPDEARKSDDTKKPDETRKSGDAQKPDEARKSGEARKPDEARKSDDTKKPDETRKSGDAQKPDEVRKSGDTQKPDEVRKSGEAQKPDEVRKSADAHKPDEASKSGDTKKPDEVRKSADAHKPDEASKSGDTKKPGEAGKSDDTKKPDEATKSDDTKKSDEATKSDDTKKPDEVTKSDEATKSDDTKAPDDSKKSDEAQKPEEGRKSEEAKQPEASEKQQEEKLLAEDQAQAESEEEAKYDQESFEDETEEEGTEAGEAKYGRVEGEVHFPPAEEKEKRTSVSKVEEEVKRVTVDEVKYLAGDEEYREREHEDYDEYQEGEEGFREERPSLHWEREAKKKVHIEMEERRERRKSIYELDSYASSGPSVTDILKLSDAEPEEPPPPPRIRYSVSMGVQGIARINLSELTQKIVGCVIGENVTTEYPWVFVRKDIIEDNLDLHSESSEFLPMKEEIESFPDSKMLIGYAPSLTEEGQFYICLTEEGRDAIMRQIQMQRQEHENRVRNAVYKTPEPWIDLGSAEEVAGNLVTNTRPLFEIEVVSTGDVLNAPMNFVDRKADDQRDGYVELLPYRQTFDNVSSVLVPREVQVMQPSRDNEAQTETAMLVNSWSQYDYQYQPVDPETFNEEQLESFKSFLRSRTDQICNEAAINATWDIHANDYGRLAKSEKDTLAPVTSGYTQHQSYHEGKLIGDKVINDLSWHQFWTGIVTAAYTRYAKSDRLTERAEDEVARAQANRNCVLIWSFTDCLTPKLVLDCPREVTAVSNCPVEGNIIVGGCDNGQVVIWHIPGKIEQVESVIVRTSAQVKYRIALMSLMAWMRAPTGGHALVKPAAMSSIHYSQKGSITQIIWVPSHYKVDKSGKIVSLPADSKFEDLSMQFVTASMDGTVAFWDLKWRPSEKESRQRERKRGKKVQQPDELAQSISPFKVFDRIFRPDYLLSVQYPDSTRRPVITTLSMYCPKFRKVQTEPFPIDTEDITIRRYYKLVIEKPKYEMMPVLLLGTVAGEVGSITWEGFQFETGVPVNREECQWTWLKGVHDGPVTNCVRSKYLPNMVATVGGKIFAVWRDDFREPLVMKKSKISYTACTWGSFRPTVLILTRIDGTVEIWDFLIKSHEPSFKQSLSGNIITGIYTHELYLNPQCVGFCDYHGTLRICYSPTVFLEYDEADIRWMQKFVDKQVERITEFMEWQKDWHEQNIHSIEMRKQMIAHETEMRRQEAERKEMEEAAEAVVLDEEEEEAKKAAEKKKKRYRYSGEAREKWMALELKRMQHVILEKKGLRKDILEKQSAPVMMLREEEARKKRRLREIVEMQDQIFQETVAVLFPEQHLERKRVSVDPQLALGTVTQTATPERHIRDTFALAEVAGSEATLMEDEPDYRDPAEDIISEFMDVQAEAMANLETRRIKHTFNWRKVLLEGKQRRLSLDIELKRRNKPKTRRVTEENEQSRPSLVFRRRTAEGERTSMRLSAMEVGEKRESAENK